MDQGSTRKRSAVHNFAPTVTKFCVMWEGQALPHDTKFGNSRCEIVGRRVIFIWSLIHGSSWSGLIKVRPGCSNELLIWFHHARSYVTCNLMEHPYIGKYKFTTSPCLCKELMWDQYIPCLNPDKHTEADVSSKGLLIITVNWLTPEYLLWYHITSSKSVQVMAWSLIVPKHYLLQRTACNIDMGASLKWNIQNVNLFKNDIIRIIAISPRRWWNNFHLKPGTFV